MKELDLSTTTTPKQKQAMHNTHTHPPPMPALCGGALLPTIKPIFFPPKKLIGIGKKIFQFEQINKEGTSFLSSLVKLKINFNYFQFYGKMWAIIENHFRAKRKRNEATEKGIGKECHRQSTIINHYATFAEMQRVGGKKKKKEEGINYADQTRKSMVGNGVSRKFIQKFIAVVQHFICYVVHDYYSDFCAHR